MVSWGPRPPAWLADLGSITLPWASLWRAESWGCSRSPGWGSQKMQQGSNLHWGAHPLVCKLCLRAHSHKSSSILDPQSRACR